MATYYDILKVSPKASRNEIKSAYRRLARKLHPDAHTGSEATALVFAEIAEAYEVLSNPKERAAYDRRLLEMSYNGSSASNSVFSSANPHAARWRQMAYERRYNEIIDRMIADERRESMALQRTLFPLVALFISIFVVFAAKPHVFSDSVIVGRIVIISLFAAGIIHLFGRLRDIIERYSYDDNDLHDSILDNDERPQKPYSRLAVLAFIVVGSGISAAAGLAAAIIFDISALAPSFASNELTPEVVFYPPIFVLFVDAVHTVAARFESP